MKVYEVLAKDLSCFGEIEEFEQEIIADYINCPSSEDCKYDGRDNYCCTECKIKYLESEWD